MSLRIRWVLALAALGSTSACGGDEKEVQNGPPGQPQCPPGQYFDGMYCQMQTAGAGMTAPPAQGYPPSSGTQPGVPPGAGTQPGATPNPTPPSQPSGPIATTTPGPNATPLDPTAAQAATQVLGVMARQHTPAGAQPIGAAIAGQFGPGQSLSAQVTMQPGKCYTVIAAGAPPVSEVDVQLVPMIALPGLASPVLATDKTQGPSGVIGSKAECFRWAFPFPAAVKVVLSVPQGNGIAAAQVFEATAR